MIIIAGTFRAPAGRLDAALGAMEAMILASRAEPGCLTYAYSRDVLDPDLIRVVEIWRDAAAFAAHLDSGHIQSWRAQWPELGLHERRLERFESGPGVAV